MPDGTGASRDEIDRVIAALTDGELFKLKHFAVHFSTFLTRALPAGKKSARSPICRKVRDSSK